MKEQNFDTVVVEGEEYHAFAAASAVACGVVAASVIHFADYRLQDSPYMHTHWTVVAFAVVVAPNLSLFVAKHFLNLALTQAVVEEYVVAVAVNVESGYLGLVEMLMEFDGECGDRQAGFEIEEEAFVARLIHGVTLQSHHHRHHHRPFSPCH